MKNVKVLNSELWLLALGSAFLAFTVFGCNKSLQAIARPDSASVDDLMPEAVRIIREGLADENPQIRAKAIEVVAATQRIELMPEVQQLLKDDFVPVRFAAALAAGDLKYHPAQSSITQSLKDQDENIRIAAAYAMNRLRPPGNLDQRARIYLTRRFP